MQTDSGYTLVELLMATAVGAVVVAAAYASYAVVSGYYEKLSDMADLQDTGRQSLYMMVRDIRMAGYEHYAYNKATKTYESEYGPVSGLIKITDSGDACCDGIDVTYDLGKCRGAVGRDPSTNQEDKAICEKNGGTWDGEVERVKIGYYTLGKCRGAAGGDQAACEKNGGTWTGRLYRSKAIWKKNESKWSTDEKDGAYQDAVVADHIENFQVQQCPLRLKWSGKYTDIATDASGNVWVADYYNHRVEKFDSSGTSLGKFNWGHAYGVATDANGYVYVANYSSHQILKIDPSTGNVKLGIPCRKGPCAPGSGAGQFLYLNGVDVDASGNIYVAGSHNTRIQKFDKSGNFLYQLGPKGTGFRQIQFSSTEDVATDADGNVWVADFVSNRIQKFDPDGKLLFGIPCKKGKCAPGSGDGEFRHPNSIATDADGNVYVAEWRNHRIQKFDSSGNFLGKWGVFGSGTDPIQFKYPKGIAIDARGNVYVAEPCQVLLPGVCLGEGRVQKFSTTPPPAAATTCTNGCGSISPAGPIDLACGEEQTFTITPAPGFKIADVLVDGVSVGAVSTYTLKAQQCQTTSLTETCTSTASGGACTATFTGITPGTTVKATVCVEGDINSSHEYVDIDADGTSLGSLCKTTACGQCSGTWQDCTEFDVSAQAADGKITFKADGTGSVGSFCPWDGIHSMKMKVTLEFDTGHEIFASFEPDDYKDYAGVSDQSAHDHKKLGESWSKPLIVNIKAGGKKKWVAVYGAGFNNATATNYGSALYVIDLENGGELLKRIDLSDNAGNGIANAVPAEPVAVTRDGTTEAEYYGAMVYFADLEGKLWKINLTDQGTLYDKTILFDAEATSGTAKNERLSFNSVIPTIGAGGCLWLYFGTGDQREDKLELASPGIQNRVYGIKDPDFPEFKTIGTPLTENGLVKGDSGSCPDDCEKSKDPGGWFYELDATEKVIGVTVDAGWVYFTHFRPNAADPCSPGDGYITYVYFICPGSIEYPSETIKIGQGVPTAPVVSGDKIIVGIANPDDTHEDVEKVGDSAIGIKKPDSAVTGSGSEQEPIETWREIF